MEKREKIIVVATVIAALYGTVDFLFLSKKGAITPISSQNSPAEINNVTAKLATQTYGKNDKVQKLVQQINTPWPQKVFLQTSPMTNTIKTVEDINIKAIEEQFSPEMFAYSGFLVMGSNKMAIVNGTDYKLGDNIKGFILAEITPKYIKVVMQEVPFEVEIKQPIKP